MKSLPVIWCLVSLSALAGLGGVAAQEKRKDPKPKVESAVSIWTAQHKMWLYIYSNGSGTIGYGDGGSYQGHFKPETFDVAQVTQELKALAVEAEPEEAWKVHYAFGFESERVAPEKPGPVRYTKDNKLILTLFEKAIETSYGLSDFLERPLLRAEIEKCRLAGTWVVASAEADGQPVAALEGTKLTMVDNELTAVLGGTEQSGTYTIDPAETPKHIELWIGDTSGQWFRSYGVYELDGDELRVCRTGDLASLTGIQAAKVIANEVVGGRPAKLDSTLGVLLVLKRETK